MVCQRNGNYIITNIQKHGGPGYLGVTDGGSYLFAAKASQANKTDKYKWEFTSGYIKNQKHPAYVYRTVPISNNVVSTLSIGSASSRIVS